MGVADGIGLGVMVAVAIGAGVDVIGCGEGKDACPLCAPHAERINANEIRTAKVKCVLII